MVRKINGGVVYRVGELDWVHGSFFTDSLDYYDHSATGYRKEDAKPYILDLTDAKVFDPVKEWNLSVEGWSDMRQTEEFFNSKGLDGYEYLDGVDYDDPDSYHEVMADADVLAAWAREHDYDAVIFRDVPTAGYGPSFTEYCVFNKSLVKPADLVERIVRKGSKWQVQSEDGTRNLGTYDTKAEAEKRLRQVHYFKHVNECDKTGSLPEDVKVTTADIKGAEFAGSKPELVDSIASAYSTISGGKHGRVTHAYALTDEHVSALVGFLEGFNADMARGVRHFCTGFSMPGRPLLLTATLSVTEKGINTLWYELTSPDRRWVMGLGSIHVSGHEYLRSADSDDETLTDDVNEAAICMAIDKMFGLDYVRPSAATLETVMAEFDAEYRREHPLGEDVSIKACAAHQRPFMYERRDNKESGDTHELWELPPDCVNTLADMLEDVDEGYGGLPTLLRHIADAGDSVTLAIDDYGDEDLIQYTLLLAGGGNFILVYLPKGDLASGMKGYGDSEPVREAKLIRILDDVFGFDVIGRFLKDAHMDEDVKVRPSGSPLVKLIGVKYPNPRETIYMYSLGQEGLDRLLDAMLGAGRGFSANVYDAIRGGRFPNAQLNVRVNNQDRKTDVLQCAMYLMPQGKGILDYEPLCTVGLAMEGDRLVYGGDLDATLAIEKGLDLPYKHASDFIANAGTEPVHIVDEDVSISASANRPPLLYKKVSGGVSSYVYGLSEPEMLALARVVRDHEGDVSLYITASVGYIAKKISKGGDFVARLHIVTYDLERGDVTVSYRLDTSDSDGPLDSMTIAQCGGKKGSGTMEDDGQASVMFDIDAALGISHATELFRRGEEPDEEGLDEDVNISASGDAVTLLRDGNGADGGHWWSYGINDPAAIRMLMRFAPSYGHMLDAVADLYAADHNVNPRMSITVHPTFVKYEFHSDRSFNAILLYITAPAETDHTDVRRALMLERALGISHMQEWLSANGTLTEPDAMEDRSWKDGSWKRLHSEDDEDSIPLSMAERYVQTDADDFRWSIRVKGKDGEWLYGRHYELDDQRLNGLMTLSQAYWLLPKAAEAGEADIVIDVTYNDDQAYSIMTMRKGG